MYHVTTDHGLIIMLSP